MSNDIEQYYTQEQLDWLAARREELGGDEGMRKVEAEWADLIAQAKELQAAGVDPADERVQRIVTRWDELVAMFHGGYEGVKTSLNRMWQEKDPAELSRGMFDASLMEFIAKGRASGGV